MFYKIFFSPQVKQCTIFTDKHGVYELPHELSQLLKTYDISKLGDVRKLLKCYRIIT